MWTPEIFLRVHENLKVLPYPFLASLTLELSKEIAVLFKHQGAVRLQSIKSKSLKNLSMSYLNMKTSEKSNFDDLQLCSHFKYMVMTYLVPHLKALFFGCHGYHFTWPIILPNCIFIIFKLFLSFQDLLVWKSLVTDHL